MVEKRVPLGSGEIRHELSVITELVDDENLDTGLTSDDNIAFDAVIEGGGVHCFLDKIVPCKVGDVYVVPRNTEHGYFITEPDARLVIRRLSFNVKDWFRSDAATESSQHFCYGIFKDGATVAYAMLNSRMKERVGALLDAIERELADREYEWRTLVQTELVQLFAYVARYINRSEKNERRCSRDAELTASVIEIVEAELLDRSLSLEGIAARLFVSPSSLSRIFKAQSGQLFSDYLRSARIRYAAGLITESDETVEGIVSECGFKDISSFYRNFRAIFGMTPQAYKRLTLSNKENQINIKKEERKMEILAQISANVQIGKAKLVKELVQSAIDAGAVPEEILNEGLLAGMSVIGEKFKNNEVFVPEVLVAARAMSMGVQLLKPYLTDKSASRRGKVCIGTVQGDLHDIGKNLVKMMMEGKGLEVVDLGTDVAPETFIKAAVDEGCQIICCSALLTTTMSVMGDVVKAAEAAGIRDKVKIMIGGAPINEEFCQKIGADCYTTDAASAADAAVKLCEA